MMRSVAIQFPWISKQREKERLTISRQSLNPMETKTGPTRRGGSNSKPGGKWVHVREQSPSPSKTRGGKAKATPTDLPTSSSSRAANTTSAAAPTAAAPVAQTTPAFPASPASPEALKGLGFDMCIKLSLPSFNPSAPSSHIAREKARLSEAADWAAKTLRKHMLNVGKIDVASNKVVYLCASVHSMSTLERNLQPEMLGHANNFTGSARVQQIINLVINGAFANKKTGGGAISTELNTHTLNARLENVTVDVFPLHDYEALAPLSAGSTWSYPLAAKTKKRIADYFGPKIALYFVFLDFYISWLIPTAFAGVCLELYFNRVFLRALGAKAVVFAQPLWFAALSMAGVLDARPVPTAAAAATPAAAATAAPPAAAAAPFEIEWSSHLFAALISIGASVFIEFWKRHRCTVEERWDSEHSDSGDDDHENDDDSDVNNNGHDLDLEVTANRQQFKGAWETDPETGTRHYTYSAGLRFAIQFFISMPVLLSMVGIVFCRCARGRSKRGHGVVCCVVKVL